VQLTPDHQPSGPDRTQDDWDSFCKFTPTVTKELQVVGDDLTVTNPKKIKEAAEKG
jgi:enolase